MVGQGQQPSSNQQWVLGLAQGDLADSSRVRLVEFLAGRAHSYHLTPDATSGPELCAKKQLDFAMRALWDVKRCATGLAYQGILN